MPSMRFRPVGLTRWCKPNTAAACTTALLLALFEDKATLRRGQVGPFLKLKLHRLKPDWKRAGRRLDEDETIGKREIDH